MAEKMKLNPYIGGVGGIDAVEVGGTEYKAGETFEVPAEHADHRVHWRGAWYPAFVTEGSSGKMGTDTAPTTTQVADHPEGDTEPTKTKRG